MSSRYSIASRHLDIKEQNQYCKSSLSSLNTSVSSVKKRFTDISQSTRFTSFSSTFSQISKSPGLAPFIPYEANMSPAKKFSIRWDNRPVYYSPKGEDESSRMSFDVRDEFSASDDISRAPHLEEEKENDIELGREEEEDEGTTKKERLKPSTLSFSDEEEEELYLPQTNYADTIPKPEFGEESGLLENGSTDHNKENTFEEDQEISDGEFERIMQASYHSHGKEEEEAKSEIEINLREQDDEEIEHLIFDDSDL